MKRKLNSFLRISFYCLMKPFVWFYVIVFQHVRFNRNGYKVPKGPVLFISNHVTNWDPFYLNCMFFNRIIRFIAHDELFKNKAMAWFSKNILGEVCRGKTDENISDILQMRRLAKSGATLGLYPEGDIDMFGRTLPIENSVAKFAKLLGVPVVLTKVQGAYIRAPRWAKYARHAHITYSITDVIMPNEIKALSVNELYIKILDGISFDENMYQRKLKYKQFNAFKRAEWLELGLFYCPNCEKFETLSSKGSKIKCKECGFIAKYNLYGMLEPVNVNFPYSLLTDWDDKQKEVLFKRIEFYNGNKPFLYENHLDYYCVKRGEYFKKPKGKSTLKVYKDRIEIIIENEESKKIIYLKDIKKASLQYKDVLEVHDNENYFRFKNKKRKWSAYLYSLTINHLIKISKEKK